MGTRRAGYTLAVLINVALLYGAWWWPGWQALPFLTGDTGRVLGLITASLAAGAVVNVVYLVDDSRWLRDPGELVTAGLGLAAIIRLLQVFPFAFTGSFPWAGIVRMVLVLGVVGAGLGVLVAVGRLVRPARHRPQN
jgi:hypothetical protein